MFCLRPHKEDSALLLKIKKLSIPQCSTSYDDKDIKAWLAYCNAQEPKTCFTDDQGFIAYNNDKPIGFVTFSDKNNLGHIDNMFILPAHTKKSLGTTLLQLAEKNLRKNDIKTISIRVTLNAQDFYAHFGYLPKKSAKARAGFEIVIMEK